MKSNNSYYSYNHNNYDNYNVIIVTCGHFSKEFKRKFITLMYLYLGDPASRESSWKGNSQFSETSEESLYKVGS